MSFNRRGPDRRSDRPDRPERSDRGDRPDRPARDFNRPNRRPPGEWQPRERPAGGDRPGPPRGGGDRPYAPRGGGGGDRPYAPRGGDRPYPPRPRFDHTQDEGGMSIRLDPRRLSALKQLAAEADTRPGELVRKWVEERLDAERSGAVAPAATGAQDLSARLTELADRVAALERGAAGGASADPKPKPKARARKRVSAKPSGERVALHDEIIAVVSDRGPLPAAEIATIIEERGRYSPPRSGKPLDAGTVNARVSNPTYRSRFTRDEGRIGLADSG